MWLRNLRKKKNINMGYADQPKNSVGVVKKF